MIEGAGAPRRISANEITWRPPDSDPHRLVRVIVQVDTPSVAQAEGDAAEAGVAFGEVEAARAAVDATAAQSSVIDAIVAEGGTIDRRNVHAVNR